MDSSIARWDTRLDRAIVWLLWITLAVGVFTVFVRDGAIPSSYTASGLGAAFVLTMSVLPAHVGRRILVRELLIVAGSLLTMIAVAITGDVASPFLLLSLMPVLYAGIRGGFRAGIGAAALSAAILASVVIPKATPPWIELVQWMVLLFLVAVTFAYAQRLITEAGLRSDALAAASADTSARLERLETAHRLLTRLAARAESAELNPIEVGLAALDSVRGVVPYEAASINLASESGQVAVARIGEANSDLIRTAFPMRSGDREVGTVILGTNRELSTRQLDSVEAVLQPATLAFSNVLLLQQIARTAIREERNRLARELHDDIGPSLASLGLALDLAALQYPTEPALGAHLKDLRISVAHLVEDVRATVTDLRTGDHVRPLRDAVIEVARSTADQRPSILYEVLERRQIRPSIAGEVNAIVVEALRNAVNHADASTVTIRGYVDFNEGSIEVSDDGRGFDVDSVRAERFGLVGMRERAELIGASLDISSNDFSTSVVLSWAPS